MCEANAYLLDEAGAEKLLLESVDKVYPEEDNIILESIFGERKIIKAKIVRMELVDHRIILQKQD
ncbi:CooT family nickel-binding protein [Dehalobacter sp. DCM]|uniref:CooT family nickel-binding protein n=1 Tax=Dehalobacter sp. DCM TaxID=2907827 RepID=UPI003081E03E|nr:CooT family nickel-binding protein [Dehalobacter sp. DCM]